MRRLLMEAFQTELVQNHEGPVVDAPEEEGQRIAVPEPRQNPDDRQVEKLSPFAAAVSAQGNVDIVPEPPAERNMPAAPELRRAR